MEEKRRIVMEMNGGKAWRADRWRDGEVDGWNNNVWGEGIVKEERGGK